MRGTGILCKDLDVGSHDGITEAMGVMLLRLIREGLVDVTSLNGEWKI